MINVLLCYVATSVTISPFCGQYAWKKPFLLLVKVGGYLFGLVGDIKGLLGLIGGRWRLVEVDEG